jgi:hypothetical protein
LSCALWFAIPLLIVLGLARADGALSDRFEAPSVVPTLDIIMGLLLAETLLAFNPDGKCTNASLASSRQSPD